MNVATLLLLHALALQTEVPVAAPAHVLSADPPPATVTEAIDRCEILEYPAPEAAIKVADAGLALEAERSAAQSGLLKACRAGAMMGLGQMDEARALTMDIDPLSIEGGEPRDRVGLMIRLAQLHFRSGDPVSSLEAMDDALQLAETEQLDRDLPQVLGNLAIFLTESGQFEAAIAHFERILELAEAEQAAMAADPAFQPSIPLVPVRFNFARALMLAERFGEAVPHLEWLIAAMDRPDEAPRRAAALSMLATAYGEMEAPRAQATMELAVALHATFDNPGERSTLRLDQARLARRQGDLETAETHARDALALSRLIRYDRSILSSLDFLVDVLSEQGEYQEALALHREYAELNQGFLEQTQASRLDLLETRLGVQRQAAELEEVRRISDIQRLQLRQETFQRRVAWSALVAVLIIGLILAVWQRGNQNKLLRISRTDSLTGLPNRRYLTLQMQQHSSDPNKAALILLDLDHFKQINDEHGHDVGDRVLTAVSDRIQRAVLPNDALCGRWGGEEFAVFLPDTDAEACQSLAETLRREIAALDLEDDDGRTIHVTASLGFAPIRGLTRDSGQELWEPALKCADLMLYKAKHSGRNRAYGAWPAEPETEINPLALEAALQSGRFRTLSLAADES
jgi:diguanylate cyclase (GGDEF)-like protein